MNNETIKYNNKSYNNRKRTTGDEQLFSIQLIMSIIWIRLKCDCPNICIGLFAGEKGELKAALYGHKEGWNQPANESNTVKKKYAYSRLQGLLLQKERVKSVYSRHGMYNQNFQKGMGTKI
jgi:hypothetical protein